MRQTGLPRVMDGAHIMNSGHINDAFIDIEVETKDIHNGDDRRSPESKTKKTSVSHKTSGDTDVLFVISSDDGQSKQELSNNVNHTLGFNSAKERRLPRTDFSFTIENPDLEDNGNTQDTHPMYISHNNNQESSQHFLLGKSVSSYLENDPTLEFPTCPNCETSRLSSGHSTSSVPDSGVCSEATSAVEPFPSQAHGSSLNPIVHSQSHLQGTTVTPCGNTHSQNGITSKSPVTKASSLPLQENLQNSVEKSNGITLNANVINEVKVVPNLAGAYKSVQSFKTAGKTDHIPYKKNVSQSHSKLSMNGNPSYAGETSLARALSRRRKWSVPNDKTPSESFCSKYTSCRWQLAYVCFLARFIQTALRQCMGVAIIGMTLQREIVQKSPESVNGNWSGVNTSETMYTSSNTSRQTTNVTYTDQEFHWSSLFEGVILSSFNVGSIITPIIIGYLTIRYGGRTLMTVCLLSGGIFTILLPVSAKAEPSMIIVLRILCGIALSGIDSLIQAMWAKWAPLYEKASLSSSAYTGLSVAGVLTFLVSGYLSSIGGEGKGWPNIFYLFGTLCLLLAPVWWYTVYNCPEKHPRISKRELSIITYNKLEEKPDADKQPLNTPWKAILKSPAVWVILAGHVTNKWILSFMLSYLPRYFSDMFHVDLETDGLYASLPFAGRIVSGVVAAHLSDWMLVKGVSTVRTRKTFQTAGCWGCAVTSLLLAYVPSLSKAWSISLMVISLSFQNLTSVAFRINLLDIAPRYAGLLNGVISTVATLTSLPAPVITSLLISGGSYQGWQTVFCLVAIFNIFGGLIYLLYAQGEIQPWAMSDYVGYVSPDSSSDTPITIVSMDAGISDTPLKTYKVSKKRAPVREVKSFPSSILRRSKKGKETLSRRATLDVGALINRVHSAAFAPLALADL